MDMYHINHLILRKTPSRGEIGWLSDIENVFL